MPDRFSKVCQEIYRGGKPSFKDLETLANLFKVKRIVSLDGEIGNDISPLVKLLGMEHVIIPIAGKETKSNINLLKNKILDLVKKQPVYVHCRHGSDRTGMAIAFIRLNQGWSPEQALIEAKSFGFGNKLDSETEKAYTSFITGDSNAVHDNFNSNYDALFQNYSEKIPYFQEGDIVAEMRNQFNMGDVPPAFNPQQSFAPKEDIKLWMPDEEFTNPNPEHKDPYMAGRKIHHDRKVRIEELEQISNESIPQVGQYDNSAGIRGVGPVETGNILL